MTVQIVRAWAVEYVDRKAQHRNSFKPSTITPRAPQMFATRREARDSARRQTTATRLVRAVPITITVRTIE